MSIWNPTFPSLYGSAHESSFSIPENRTQEETDWFGYFDFSKTMERELYLLCAANEKVTHPTLIKIKCIGDVREQSSLPYRFSCVVTEIEGEEIEEKKRGRAYYNDSDPITPERQVRVLRQALAEVEIVDGNFTVVSETYIRQHLEFAQIRKEIKARKQRKGGNE